MKALFEVSAFYLFYVYLGYPLVLGLLSSLKPKKTAKAAPFDFPAVSIVISACDEEKNIGARLENLRGLDYPKDKVEIIVVSDGSKDGTKDVVRRFEGVRLFELESREGKAAALNLGVSRACGEVVVFADARQSFAQDALARLADDFRDPEVGAASGRLVLVPDSAGSPEALSVYWSYEEWIRDRESRVGSVMGATGAIYAIRRGLFRPIPAGTILDDVLIPMQIVLAGSRVILDTEARAYDRVFKDAGKEFRRKVRTSAGNFQLLHLFAELLRAGKFESAIFYFSHKITRLFAPYFLLALFAANVFLTGPAYRSILLVQAAFYGLALAGFGLRNTGLGRARLLRVPYAFAAWNYAAVLGFIHSRRRAVDFW